jgi:hypothetical protein
MPASRRPADPASLAARTELWIDEVLGAAKARQLVDMLRALGDAGLPADRADS